MMRGHFVLSISDQEHNMRWQMMIVCVALAALLAIDAATARAGGYWNMPGTISQRAGHGFSGGYHAPFILGPIRCDGWGPPNEVRLPHAPNPYCGCCSMSGCGCQLNQPTSLTSIIESTPTPQPVLEQAAPSETLAPASLESIPPAAAEGTPAALFEPPVQQ
jgi:hypothetical protein